MDFLFLFGNLQRWILSNFTSWFLLLALVEDIMGFSTFRGFIPNGYHVPNPCEIGHMWKGVGHRNFAGAGVMNPFGQLVKDSMTVWNLNVCMTDSDGDGRTNGEELGDPDCTWEPGLNAKNTTGITHPGICEPVNSPACLAINHWLPPTCRKEVYDCPRISEPDIGNFTVELNVTVSAPTPIMRINVCKFFDVPPGNFHMLGSTPLIQNFSATQTIRVLGCNPNIPDSAYNVSNGIFECGAIPDPPYCTDVITVWHEGRNHGECFDERAGFLFGTHGYRKVVLQVYIYNRMKLNPISDSSGMILHMTARRHHNDAGVFIVGQDYLVIPPGEQSHVIKGSCIPRCSKGSIVGPVYVTRSVALMNSLGVKHEIEVFHAGAKVRDTARDTSYRMMDPFVHLYTKPILVQPGDEIRVKCIYNSENRKKTTFAGPRPTDELCAVQLTYYPKYSIIAKTCTSYENIPGCYLNRKNPQPVGGCPWHLAINFQYDPMRIAFTKLLENCQAFGTCLKECKTLVKDLKNQACLRGEISRYLRRQTTKPGSEFRDLFMEFWGGLDSCNTEIALDNVKARQPQIAQDPMLGPPTPPTAPTTELPPYV